MRLLLLLFALSATLIGQAQNSAIYLCPKLFGPDLIQVGHRGDSIHLEAAWAFNSKVDTVSRNQQLQARLQYLLQPNSLYTELGNAIAPPDTIKANILPPGFNRSFADSIEVDGKWVRINIRTADDGWVGGRPNKVDRKVTVEGLGVVYSYSNWPSGYSLVMFSHQNPDQQRVLDAVFHYLNEQNSWELWTRIFNLSQAYPFENGLAQLAQRWTATQRHLRLIEQTTTREGRTIHWSATLKNVSDTAYYFAETFDIAPSKATIFYADRGEGWDLLDTHYGPHFKRMHGPLYLLPGAEVTFTHDMPIYPSCGSCKRADYYGLQVYRIYVGFYPWLVKKSRVHEGVTYWEYPHREIKR